MSDDLNTSRAVPVLEELVADKKFSPADRLALISEFDQVLGLGLATLTREELRIRPSTANVSETDIAEMLEARRQARANKDFAASDALRDELVAAGVEVMDGDPLGWDWRLSN